MNAPHQPVGQTLRLHPNDDVVIAKVRLPKGTRVETDAGTLALPQEVPAGHKIAAHAIRKGAPIHRYGQVIGFALADLEPGQHVHVDQLHMEDLAPDYAIGSDVRPTQLYPAEQMRFFDGFLRADGRVGTRNYVAIVSTVNCSSSVSKLARDRFREVQRDFPNIDGVIAFTHRGGCGQISAGADHVMLERVLGNMATHPNVAAYVIVGLGCEVNQPLTMIKHRGLTNPQAPDQPP
ncbi:MAG: UxaA family hydrolase, partial [Deltaproteobacteria bacterium]|nr:UxaA family hydrolase [Deltaproteobacteria bacterium]